LREAVIPVSAPVLHCSNLLLERRGRDAARAGLVIGCGNGDEVVHLADTFKETRVVGFDIEDRFSARARLQVGLFLADVKRLPFLTESFDFAIAIHSIEHVGDPYMALTEVARVLRPGGWFYVGVPNRTRLLGYLGSFDATLSQKIAWNLIDYTNRIRGRFKNELGAHAGFARIELERLLSAHFERVELLTEEYLHFKYDGRIPQWMLRFLLAPRLADYSAPSHYALCRKKK
jgi:SAM-dependent methyltransferase